MKKRRKNRLGKMTLALALAALMSASVLAGCDAQSGDLMANITAQPTSVEPMSEEIQGKFANATVDFSLQMFRNTWQERQNSLVSPVSSVLALGMVTNGAGGNTQKQLLQCLANGELTQQQLNQAYLQWSQGLMDLESGMRDDISDSQSFSLANAIWLHKDLAVKEGFLQNNADFFHAGAYTIDFGQTDQALRTMNEWASKQTNGKIQQAVDQLSPASLMVLMNTAFFEMPWLDPVEPKYISQRVFTAADGKKTNVDFMHMWNGYLESDLACGMIRPYRNSNFSFVALMPKEGKTLSDVVNNMTAGEWLDLVNHTKPNVDLDAYLPKFRYEVSNDLNASLQAMGVRDAFDSKAADFSAVSEQELWIDRVVQKTTIDVNEHGTSAAAVTTVMLFGAGVPVERERKTLVFDRPFLYAILDRKTGIPLFLGTVADAGQTGKVSQGSAQEDEPSVQAKIDITKCEDYQTVPFAVTDSAGKQLQTETFPEYWGGAVYCTTGPHEAFERKFQDGGAPDVVGDHTKLRFDFGKYDPKEITVSSAPGNSEPWTDVPYQLGAEAGQYEFEVDFGGQDVRYYLVSAKWDDSHKVDYAVAVKKA